VVGSEVESVCCGAGAGAAVPARLPRSPKHLLDWKRGRGPFAQVDTASVWERRTQLNACSIGNRFL
jgi:hypothetical protein